MSTRRTSTGRGPTRERQGSGGPAPVPLGPGVVARRLRMAEPDVVRLGCILAGYDGLASLHGDARGVVYAVTTEDLSRELDAVLDEAARLVAFERLPDADAAAEEGAGNVQRVLR